MEGALHKSPLKDPREILDVGTGTGIWAIDMADRYPNAKVTGIDLRYVDVWAREMRKCGRMLMWG